MLSASESVNCVELPWTEGVAGPNWPVVTCPTVFPAPVLNRLKPVSYTHLTLPTILRV